MNKIMNVVTGGLLLLVFSMANAEPGVYLDEAIIKSKVGNTVSVDLLLSGFPVTEGGGVDLSYDPGLVKVNSVVVDDSTWDFVNQNGDIDNASGTVSGILFSSYGGVSDGAKIATIEMEFVGKGRGDIVLNESGSNPFASGGERLVVKFTPTRVQVRAGK